MPSTTFIRAQRLRTDPAPVNNRQQSHETDRIPTIALQARKTKHSARCVICRDPHSEHRCQQCGATLHNECLDLLYGRCPTIGCQAKDRRKAPRHPRPQTTNAPRRPRQLAWDILVASFQFLISLSFGLLAATIVGLIFLFIALALGFIGQEIPQSLQVGTTFGLLQIPFTTVGLGVHTFKRWRNARSDP